MRILAKIFQTLFVCLISIVGAFYFAQNAKATSIYDQINHSQDIIQTNPNSNHFVTDQATSSISSSFAVSDVSFYFGSTLTGCTSSNYSGYSLHSGSDYSDVTNFTDLYPGWKTLHFATPFFLQNAIIEIDIVYSCSGVFPSGNLVIGGSLTPNPINPLRICYQNTLDCFYNTPHSPYDLYPALTFNGAPPPDPTVEFQNSTFFDNFSSPDFSNWDICENNYTGLGDMEVKWGTSTPSGNTDSVASQLGVSSVNLYAGNCVLPNKSASSTPGDYQAQAFLLDNTNTVIATSTILHFQITNGQPITYPNQVASSTPVAGCSPTGFTLVGVDFGLGVCNLTRFLFIPSQQTLNQFTSTKGLLSTTPPFSYLYTLTKALENASSTNASITPLTLMIGATSTPVHFSFDAFSNNTINKYTSSGTRGALRTLIEWGLYLSFISMVIWEVKNLFKSNKPNQ